MEMRIFMPLNLPEFIIYEYTKKDFDKTFTEGRRVNFQSIENVPDCELFQYDLTPLNFKPAPGNSDFEVIHLPITEVLELLAPESYELDSFRWHRVRKQISQDNEIEYPWVYVTTDNRVALMDGRHRLVGMAKFKNMTEAPVQVESKYKEQILKHFGK